VISSLGRRATGELSHFRRPETKPSETGRPERNPDRRVPQDPRRWDGKGVYDGRLDKDAPAGIMGSRKQGFLDLINSHLAERRTEGACSRSATEWAGAAAMMFREPIARMGRHGSDLRGRKVSVISRSRPFETRWKKYRFEDHRSGTTPGSGSCRLGGRAKPPVIMFFLTGRMKAKERAAHPPGALSARAGPTSSISGSAIGRPRRPRSIWQQPGGSGRDIVDKGVWPGSSERDRGVRWSRKLRTACGRAGFKSRMTISRGGAKAISGRVLKSSGVAYCAADWRGQIGPAIVMLTFWAQDGRIEVWREGGLQAGRHW